MRISDWSSDVCSSDLIGEEQNGRVRAGDEQIGDGVLVLRSHTGAALAATRLSAEAVQAGALDIALQGHGHDHVLVLDEVFILYAIGSGRDGGAAGCREFVADRLKIGRAHV